MSEPIRILIADDHEIVRKGLRALLATEPGYTVVGEAADGAQVIHQVRLLRPDVVLLDLVMPDVDGIAAIQQIAAERPEVRILVLTSFSSDDKVYAAIKAGALGYLLKDSSPQELLFAMQAVYQGKAALDPEVALKLVREIKDPPDVSPSEQPLTEREVEVLQLVARGLSNQAIADRLFLSERTVGNYVSSILNKLHLANRTQAALYALQEGYAKLEDTAALLSEEDAADE
jgi:NarL family two-component system response regulator LiaR